jgi:thioredoxin-related protein
MPVSIKRLFILVGLLLCTNIVLASKGINVVHPSWFKHSLYDLPSDLQDAQEAGKSGIMVFFSTSTCSYCNAIIQTSFKQADIVKRLRASYDVIGLEVISDTEVVDTKGKSLWAKDFAVQEKARFTPTMIFYDTKGKVQLRLVGYQSPEKIRGVLDYLEGKHFNRMKLSDYLSQNKSTSKATIKQKSNLNLDRRNASDKPLLLVFESADCVKCQQLRTMFKATVLQPYIKKLKLVFVNSSDTEQGIITPDGKKQSVKEWTEQLGLIYSPAMVFFNENGNEVLRVDTDILIDPYGNKVSISDENILDNIRARLQFVLDKGYISLPQFQRWRAQQSKTAQ